MKVKIDEGRVTVDLLVPEVLLIIDEFDDASMHQALGEIGRALQVGLEDALIEMGRGRRDRHGSFQRGSEL